MLIKKTLVFLMLIVMLITTLNIPQAKASTTIYNAIYVNCGTITQQDLDFFASKQIFYIFYQTHQVTSSNTIVSYLGSNGDSDARATCDFVHYDGKETNRVASILYGAGGGLIVDEVGLLLTFNNYWTGLTYSFLIIFLAFIFVLMLFYRY